MACTYFYYSKPSEHADDCEYRPPPVCTHWKREYAPGLIVDRGPCNKCRIILDDWVARFYGPRK